MMTWTLLEVESFYRPVTYLLVSIYRFHMLAPILNATGSLKIPLTGKNITRQPECACSVRWIRGASTERKNFYFEMSLLILNFFVLQFVRNEADQHGRSSRSPVMLFDIQENNNVNSFAVSWYRVPVSLH